MKFRLREIQHLLRANAPLLDTSTRGIGNGQIELQNRQTLYQALLTVAEIPSLKGVTTGVLNSEAFRRDSAVLSASDADALTKAVSALQQQCFLLLRFLDHMLPKAPAHYFAVKLPEHAKTPDERAKLIQRLTIAFDQPLRRLGYPPIDLDMFDIGSSWAELATSAIPALTVVGTLISLAISKATRAQERAKAQQELEKVKQEQAKAEQEQAKAEQEQAKAEQEQAKAEQEQAKAEQERLKLEAARLDLAVRMAEKREQLLQLEFEMRVSSFIQGSSEPSENTAFLDAAVKEIVELYDEGSEFRLQLDAPPEVQAEFPSEAVPQLPGTTKGLLPSSTTRT